MNFWRCVLFKPCQCGVSDVLLSAVFFGVDMNGVRREEKKTGFDWRKITVSDVGRFARLVADVCDGIADVRNRGSFDKSGAVEVGGESGE